MTSIFVHTHALRRCAARLLSTLLLTGTAACSLDKLVGKADLPEQILDPGFTESSAGALSAYRGALVYLRDAMGGTTEPVASGGTSFSPGYVAQSGQLSDELRFNIGLQTWSSLYLTPDHRQYDETFAQFLTWNVDPYMALQRLRGQANQAQGLLRDYPPDNHLPLVAHMLAVKGYAAVLLAELYCSGIPLSTVDYKGDFTFRPGSATDSVLTHAVALFDSAIAIVGADSVRIRDLARVGKGRALLQMGKFDEAAQAVAGVPVTYSYALQYSVAGKVPGLFGLPGVTVQQFRAGLIGDGEGENGLLFVTQRDARLPRMAAFTYLAGNSANSSPRQGMIPVVGDPYGIVLSSGVEAQLIRAEAALRRNDASWLTLLNELRTHCTDAATCPTPAPRGTGGVDSLPPLIVPQDTAATAKADILFRERAYWLFLTGHRVGDMRRLIRFYARDPETVFPTGEYDTNVPFFGNDVNLPVPSLERERNPLYSGCLNRSA